MKQPAKAQHTDKNTAISYAGYRFPPEYISFGVWVYFRFPLSLHMVEEILAARGIEVTYETVRPLRAGAARWALKFGQKTARRIRVRRSTCGDEWHLDEVFITVNGKKHRLWRAVDQLGIMMDVLVQSRRDRYAAQRLMRKSSESAASRLGL